MKNYLMIVLLGGIIVSCGSSAKDASLSGAGATFPAPYYNNVFKEYATSGGSTVTYGAVGSGGGIRSLADQTVDFGATDVFLSEEEIKDFSAEVVHIPTSLGAVVMSYNLAEVKELKLNAELISAIYRGEITRWNDSRLQAVNEGTTLPDQAITPIYRSDGSGTTYVFSDFMTKADSLWGKDLGTGKALNFKVGIASKGNPGVAGTIAETKGSIGYIGSEYALALSIPSAAVLNSSGEYVMANAQSISAAAETELPADMRLMITNSANPAAYPISTFTWIIAYKEQNYNERTVAKAQGLIKLLDYITGKEGQLIAEKTHYAPLSPAAQKNTRQIIESITYDGVAITQE